MIYIKYNDNAYKAYIKKFNDSVESCKSHPKYASFRKNADRAIAEFTSGSIHSSICAENYINCITKATKEELFDWLDSKKPLK